MLKGDNKQRPRNKNVEQLLCATAMVTLLSCGHAFAEEPPDQDQPSATPAQKTSTGKNGTLDEIVVTANRRAQRLEDVGASITSLSADKIDALNMVRAEDLVKLAPGVAAIPNNGSATSAFSIRGISQSDSAEHEEQPVAVYMDGTYIPVAAATGFPIFDVDHVEILNGPQGTLFGRNATGGSVQFFSKDPTPGFGGGASFSAGDYDLHKGQGYIYGGDDQISDRFSFYSSSRDGYVKNLDGPNLLSENVTALRNKTKVQLDDDTTAVLRLETWQSNGTSVNYQSSPSYTPAGSIYDVALPATAPNLYGYVNPSSSPYVEAVNDPGEIAKRVTTVALNVDHKIGDITLYSVTSFQKNRIHYREDSDGTPDNSVFYDDGGTSEVFTQEFRAAKDSGAFRWTAGANFFLNHGKWFVDFGQPTFCDPDSTTTCATAGANSANLPLSNSGKGAVGSTRYETMDKSYSGFGQAEYDFTDRLTGIIGARYTLDDEGFKYGFACTETLSGACETIFGVESGTAGSGALAPLSVLSQSKGLISGKAQLNYKIDTDILAYTSFSRGTKSGGYFDATAGNVPATSLSFRPETLYATEAGIKTQFFDRRVTFNADVYHYNYLNSQQFNFVDGIYFTVVNLPAVANGAEVSTSWTVVPGLTVNASGSYNDMWIKDVQPCSTCVSMNERPIDAPTLLANWGLQKTFEFRNTIFSLVYSGRYTGDRYFALINQPVVHGSPYVVHDASLRADFDNGAYISLWCNNLTNRVYQNALFDNTYQGYIDTHFGMPRMAGATVGMDF